MSVQLWNKSLMVNMQATMARQPLVKTHVTLKPCHRPGLNWGPCACKAHVMTTTLR